MMNTLWHDLVYKYDMAVRRGGRAYFLLRMRITGDKRPSSYPYISGDSFRKLADHIHEPGNNFEPAQVQIGDIVFVCQETLHEYFANIHPKITNQYVLISHNGDVTVDETIVSQLDDKIAHFFAQDLTVAHERITPIPIGFENLHIYIAGVIPFLKKLQRQITKRPPTRKNKIFFSFSIHTNPSVRGPARDYFLTNPLSETVDRFMAPRRHSKVLTTYKFVASPPGNAIESCRTWEGLHFRTIPIVKDFVAMRYFANLGLPIWIVKDWQELDGLTEKDLADRYETYIKGAKWDALHMDFWIKKIRNAQAVARGGIKDVNK